MGRLEISAYGWPSLKTINYRLKTIVQDFSSLSNWSLSHDNNFKETSDYFIFRFLCEMTKNKFIIKLTFIFQTRLDWSKIESNRRI